MIQQTRFLGISLMQRRNRRLLVVFYYVFMLLLAVVPLVFGVTPVTILGYLPQAVMLGGALGGLMYGGVVKPYSAAAMLSRNPDSLNPISLGLDSASARRRPQPLDERETVERDRAHFVAYRILLCLLVAMMIAVWAVAGVSMQFVQRIVPVLVWLLVASAFSLPQCVILWSEPDPTLEGNLTLV